MTAAIARGSQCSTTMGAAFGASTESPTPGRGSPFTSIRERDDQEPVSGGGAQRDDHAESRQHGSGPLEWIAVTGMYPREEERPERHEPHDLDAPLDDLSAAGSQGDILKG